MQTYEQSMELFQKLIKQMKKLEMKNQEINQRLMIHHPQEHPLIKLIKLQTKIQIPKQKLTQLNQLSILPIQQLSLLVMTPPLKLMIKVDQTQVINPVKSQVLQTLKFLQGQEECQACELRRQRSFNYFENYSKKY